MTSKTIIAGLVALAFVAGSLMTGSMAYAASNAQGQPFLELKAALDGIQTQVNGLTGQLQATDDDLQKQIDSFFDIFTELRATDEDLQEQIDNIPLPTIGVGGGSVAPSTGFFDDSEHILVCPPGKVMIGLEMASHAGFVSGNVDEIAYGLICGTPFNKIP